MTSSWTFDLLTGKAKEHFSIECPCWRAFKSECCKTNGTLEATLVLHRAQPSILSMLASGYTPIYPGDVPPAKLRTDPIGTGPFMLTEFKRTS